MIVLVEQEITKYQLEHLTDLHWCSWFAVANNGKNNKHLYQYVHNKYPALNVGSIIPQTEILCPPSITDIEAND